MGHPKTLITLILLACSVVGCAATRWGFTKLMRDPGDRMQAFPDEIWEEYDCEDQKLPFFLVEHNELVPRRVRPAKDFNHRMIYSLCPTAPTAVVTGELSTRIRFRGASIVRETIPDYELKPGRWVVDTFVTLPGEAEPGIYAYEVEFVSKRVRFDERITFLVE